MRESFLGIGRGPAEPPRELVSGLRGLGVPGPREDCRRVDEVEGMERLWRFKRRRLDGSIDGERPGTRGLRSEDAAGIAFETPLLAIAELAGWEGPVDEPRDDGD